MRLRNALLLVWLVVIIAGAAFYLGRITARPGVEAAQAELPANSGGPAVEQSRARKAEPALLPGDRLVVPVQGISKEAIHDTFNDKRGSDRIHEATDIMAERGTPVLAAVNGVIKKLFESKPGGLTIYQFDLDERYCYYYAHLDRYAEGLSEGHRVGRGQVIGYVGSTGNADPTAPHLHFAVFELGPEKEWWRGTPINPYPLLMRAVQR